MTDHKSDFHDALDELARRKRAERKPLDQEALMDFADDALTEEEREDLLERMIWDKDAARAALDFQELPPGDEAGLSQEDLAASLTQIKKMTAQAQPKPAPQPKMNRYARAYASLAAVFFAAAVALSMWQVDLRQKLRRFSQPTMSADLTDVYPAGVVSRDETTAPLQIDRQVHHLVFHLPRDRSAYSGYAFEIRDSEGRTLHTTTGPAPDGNKIMVAVFREFFDRPGRYRALFFGTAGDAKTQIRALELTVE